MAGVRRDLVRHHPYAHERIGFITTRAALGKDHLVLLAEGYYPVADDEYVRDPMVGARIGQEALRKALNLALLNPVGVFHVHMHLLPERRLWFSQIDLSEQRNFVPDFFKVGASMPHGALVLSPRSEAGLVWTTPSEVRPIAEFNTVGAQMKVIVAAPDGSTDYEG
jgi:diadenosine tetraphosphate (Ap4A) HIT family hydrolase